MSNRTCFILALNTDIAPTLLAHAGIQISESMQGRDLRPVLECDQATWREADNLADHPAYQEELKALRTQFEAMRNQLPTSSHRP